MDREAGEPLISIIIPFFNCSGIVPCLESLYRQSYKNHEIIVVDNNSSKGYLRLLEGHAVSLLHEPHQGSYAARNRGIKDARGEYVVFIDADCIAEKDLLKELYAAAIANGADMVLGNVCKEVSQKEKKCELVDRDIYHRHEDLFLLGKGTTANLLVSKKLLQRTDGFLTEYPSGSDISFIKHMVGLGVVYVYAPCALVYHSCRRSLGSLMAKGFRVGVANGNRVRAQYRDARGKLSFLRDNCLSLFNPHRDDIAEKCKGRPFSYTICYYLHFAAQGLGRMIGLSYFSGTDLFKKLLRYT